MSRRIPSFSSLTEAVMSAGHSGQPVWVWALWRPCLVVLAFACVFFRFLERFSTGPPHPWLVSPLLFTVAYCAMLARAVPASNAPAEPSRQRPHLSGLMSPSRAATTRAPPAAPSRFGGALDLAAVERWQYAINLHQLLINGWVLAALCLEVRRLRMPAWGSGYDPSPPYFRLGWLLWVVYSNRYVQGLDTLFLLLRDKVRARARSTAAHAALRPAAHSPPPAPPRPRRLPAPLPCSRSLLSRSTSRCCTSSSSSRSRGRGGSCCA